MRDLVTSATIRVAERRIPDPIVRAGMRRVIARRLASAAAMSERDRDRLLAAWHAGPIALVPDEPNRQHYEVPAEFFELVLGPRLKYSCCLWAQPGADLAAAEEAMLALSVARTGIEDGMRVLDIGSGWGSLTLYLAERFPDSQITAVSNSRAQGDFIRRRAAERGLSNVRHVAADLNDFEPDGRHDAAMSIEMFEHARNHARLLRRIAGWLTAGAPLFVHVFAHRRLFWPFEERGPADWMAHHFFTGGMMPSHDYFTRFESPFTVEQSWWIDGEDYRRTLEAWLASMDSRIDEVREVLAPVYGDDLDVWVQRWRMFFMACAEFFGHRSGELGVSHHVLRAQFGESWWSH